MRLGAWICAALALGLPGMAQAVCDVAYRVQPGDTLASIAAGHYGDEAQWTAIYYANIALIDAGTRQALPGAELYVPCPPGHDAPPAAPLPQTAKAELTLIAVQDDPPFADRPWPGGGMLAELVGAALDAAPDPLEHRTIWDSARADAQAALLAGDGPDIGIGWARPDCVAAPRDALCAGFHFSDPLAEVPVMVFARTGRGSVQGGADGMRVPTLCIPENAPLHDTGGIGRDAATLIRPATAEACLEQVMTGAADAAVLNLFLGATKIAAMGLRGQIVPQDPPLAHQTLHAVIPKAHWRGTALLYRVNAGLEALRMSGRRDAITARHMAVFAQLLQ